MRGSFSGGTHSRKIESMRLEYETRVDKIRNEERTIWGRRCDELNEQMVAVQELAQIMENRVKNETQTA